MPVHIIAYFLVLAVYGFSEIAVIICRKGRIVGQKRDATVWFVMLPFFLTWLSAALEATALDRPFIPSCYFTGIAVLIAGAGLRLSSLWILSSSFTTVVEKKAGQTIITTGPYAVIRHPLYLASLLIGLSAPLTLAAPFSSVFVLLTVIGVLVRIRKEESFLSEHLTGYSAYNRRTKRLIPGLY
jgi:protein-S-isoprenylcysteine O-methyltransferase Ste14